MEFNKKNVIISVVVLILAFVAINILSFLFWGRLIPNPIFSTYTVYKSDFPEAARCIYTCTEGAEGEWFYATEEYDYFYCRGSLQEACPKL